MGEQVGTEQSFSQSARDLAPRTAVAFIASAEERIAKHLTEIRARTAVVTVESVRVAGDTVEAEVTLWCGSLCGVFLTYLAQRVDGDWGSRAPTVPIAAS